MSRWLITAEISGEEITIENVLQNKEKFINLFKDNLPAPETDAWHVLAAMRSGGINLPFLKEENTQKEELADIVINLLKENGHTVNEEGNPKEGTYSIYVDGKLMGWD